MAKQFPFPASIRLKQEKRITQIFREGKLHRLAIVQAKVLPSHGETPGFLISVRKQVGTAPERNRLKRLVRESLRRHRQDLGAPFDICIFITRRPPWPVRLAQVESDIRTLFTRLGAKKKPPEDS